MLNKEDDGVDHAHEGMNQRSFKRSLQTTLLDAFMNSGLVLCV